MSGPRAHVIVFGNEKGGSGKTTAAMHVAVALARLDKRIALIDLDSRQQSLMRYAQNRADWCAREDVGLAGPEGFSVPRGHGATLDDKAREEAERFAEILADVGPRFDFVLIDTPGSDTPLSRLAHAEADTLVTPMNDSFVDFDLLAHIDPASFKVKGPSLYSDFVWDCRKKRLLARKPALDWVVMRNRISSSEARNKKRLSSALDSLAGRVGFRVAPGFGDRVIFRELFPMGLTMLDLPQKGVGISLSMSHVAARQEVRELIVTLNLPGIGKETGIL
ncbi:MAG: ParA family protein [Alphaproteobacteria bacterium]|nr:ParA family protein [Alphaproteobacteria bacterium]MBU6472855.1 ParA family protein [Alphaproteobacteria bacterium]MDE2012982.1 AAA family ATPase [Alphaproteobacteria bacterium]MDE2073745.1 AAA family ATPase [Alphaproteobacteria bacterium]MDE2352730.1 AAA family ATPase [Alphaproteobacteria bacterium]